MPSVVIIGGMLDEAGVFPKAFDEFDERWGINNCWTQYDVRPDLIIAMDDLERDLKTHPEYVSDIVDSGIPVMASAVYSQWPTVTEYPLADVVASQFGDRSWLDNTVNYALALAMHRGFDQIGLYGCEFVRSDPVGMMQAYSYQLSRGRPAWRVFYGTDAVNMRRHTEPGGDCMMFLLGRCIERGIDIFLPEDTTIFDNDRPEFFYGYERQPRI